MHLQLGKRTDTPCSSAACKAWLSSGFTHGAIGWRFGVTPRAGLGCGVARATQLKQRSKNAAYGARVVLCCVLRVFCFCPVRSFLRLPKPEAQHLVPTPSWSRCLSFHLSCLGTAAGGAGVP